MDKQTDGQEKRISDMLLSVHIEEARRSKATKLVFFRQGLTQWPEALGSLTQLRELNLSNNRLTVVPEALGQLTHLQRLYLFYNKLTAVLEALGRLTQLQGQHKRWLWVPW